VTGVWVRLSWGPRISVTADSSGFGREAVFSRELGLLLPISAISSRCMRCELVPHNTVRESDNSWTCM
jgi:hypothetical protein